jgi:hypothetical protein
MKILELPAYLKIITSYADGNTANWQFYQGHAEGWTGQYNLDVLFKTRLLSSYQKIDEAYYVDWNIEINGRELVDEKSGKRPPIPLTLIN